MRAVRLLAKLLAVLIGLGVVFVLGFGYGGWYSTKPKEAKGERKVLYYVDAMHPWYESDKPGVAPDCGMKLQPVYAQDSGTTAPQQPPPSDDAIQVTTDQQHLIGVRYGEVQWSTPAETIHASGRVVPDETAIMRVQARTDGWITKVSADFTGKLVTTGQPLLTLYSPEVFAAQQEYLLALKARAVMSHSSMLESMANNESLIEAAKRRLMLLNLTDAQIADLEQTQKPVQSIVLYSPGTGYVMTRNAYPGQRVTAETELYTIADLSGVWVMADVFEIDAQRVLVGQGAQVTIPGMPASTFARVTYIQPQVDPATRTTKVRLELANPKMQLRPDMWVTVDISLGGGRKLTVPAEAVLDAGTKKTVFVDRGNGYFEPRAVETGTTFSDASGGRVEIVKGLKAGERIVTSGTFLLNSESQMKSGAGGMADMPGMSNEAKPGISSESKPTPVKTDTPAKAGVPDMPDMPGMPGVPTRPGAKK
jgi:Cu(I)/Ag(I) efflux system membrane fusion protein